MSLAWILSALLLLLSICEILCSCIAPPVQFPRCERSLPPPGFQLIPAALYFNGQHHFIRPLETIAAPPTDVKRQTRQHQSSVVQQVTINQNTAISGGRPSFGFGSGRDDRPFGSPHHHHSSPHDFGHSSHGFGRPHSGFSRPHSGFRGRSFEKTDDSAESTKQLVQLPRCASSYIFSCQPTVTPLPCSQKKSCS